MVDSFSESIGRLSEALREAKTHFGISSVLHRAFSPELGLAPVESASLLSVPFDPTTPWEWEHYPLWPHLGRCISRALSESAVSALVGAASSPEPLIISNPEEAKETGLEEWLVLLGGEAASIVALLPAQDSQRLMGVLVLKFGDVPSPDRSDLEPYQVLANHIGVELGRLARDRNAFDGSDERIRQLGSQYDLLLPILDAVNDAIVLVSPDRRVLLANQRVLEFLDIPESENYAEWSHDRRLVHFLDRLKDPNVFEALLPSLEIDFEMETGGEIELMGPPLRIFSWFCKPVYEIDGALLGRLYMASDVTRERQTQKDHHDLIGMIGKELRGVLNPLMGFLSVVMKDSANQLSEKTRKHLRYVQYNFDQAIWLLRGIIDLERIYQGEMRLHPSPIVVGDVMNAMVTHLMPQMKDLSLTPSLNLPEDLPSFQADLDRFRRMVYPLLLNAITCAPHGTTIDIEAFETSMPSAFGPDASLNDGTAWGIVCITSRDKEDALLLREHPPKKYGARKSGPQTLGMHLANAFARLHGGSAWVNDSIDGRISFFLGLPLAGVWRRIAQTERKAPLVMLAIPSANRYRDLRGDLQNAGYEVVTAGNVVAALRMAQTRPPALIILTRNLPERGNISVDEFGQQAKEAGISVLQLSIIMGSDGNLLFSFSPSAGFKQDIAPVFRPFNVMVLLRLLSESLNRVLTRILIVDDYQRVLPDDWQFLRRHYHSVWNAQATDQAIDMAYSLLPNLIVVAIDSSNIDYSAIVDNLRSDPRTDWIPFIGMSRIPPHTLPHGLEEVISHPIHGDTLLSAIDRWLQYYPERSADDEPPPPD